MLFRSPGLTRAYARAAKDALDAAGKARMRPFTVLRLTCPYPMLERIRLLVSAQSGSIERTDFAAAVTLEFLLPKEHVSVFSKNLTELSGGSMEAEAAEDRFLPGPRE